MTKTVCDGCAVELSGTDVNYVTIAERRLELCNRCATPILDILTRRFPSFPPRKG